MNPPFAWHMPVNVSFGRNRLDSISGALGEQSVIVLVFEHANTTGLTIKWRNALGARLVGWIDIADWLSSIVRAREIAARVWPLLDRHPGCTIVAVGGGTTLDIAKLVRCRPLSGDFELIVHALRGTGTWPALTLAPLWLVPTTAGTGSEVTRWATVWDTQAEPPLKRSFDESFGYAERAFVDPELTLTCPEEVTRDCALDALSHALEAIWNRHANPVSDQLAISAAKRIITALPRCLEAPGDYGFREQLSLAALEAGLAFSQTRTALAHALSYAVTLDSGVPHGRACALWLPTAWRLALGKDNRVDQLLGQLFADPDGLVGFQTWLERVGVDARPEAFGIADAPARVEAALASIRGRNFMGATAS